MHSLSHAYHAMQMLLRIFPALLRLLCYDFASLPNLNNIPSGMRVFFSHTCPNHGVGWFSQDGWEGGGGRRPSRHLPPGTRYDSSSPCNIVAVLPNNHSSQGLFAEVVHVFQHTRSVRQNFQLPLPRMNLGCEAPQELNTSPH